MYKNIYFERLKNTMHLWCDTTGYRTFPYNRYAYEPAVNGQYTSIYGDKLTKIYKFKKGQEGLFESDVPETTRALVDTYLNNDEVSNGIVMMTFDIEIEMESGEPDSKEATNEIIAISLHDSVTDQYWVLVVDKSGKMVERVTKKAIVLPFESEIELCLKFLELYEEIRPDIITGWNIDYFDIPYMYNRLKRILGEIYAKRLSPIGQAFYSTYRERFFLAGVSCLDYLSLYKEYTFGELPNYRLDTVAKKELKRGKIEYMGNLDSLFNTDIEKFIEYSLVDTELVVLLERKLQFIELARDICHVGHVPYEDFVYSSKYLEGALLVYLKKRNLVAPNKKPKIKLEIKKGIVGEDKLFVKNISDDVPNSGTLKIFKTKTSKILVLYDSINRTKNYFRLSNSLINTLKKDWVVSLDLMGAYVKSPIVGRYEWIYDLDLTSLYPSIIMTLNISPESKITKVNNWDVVKYMNDSTYMISINGKTIGRDKFRDYIIKQKLSIASNGVIYATDKVGCIPGILSGWFDKRVEYNKKVEYYAKIGDTEKYEFYDKRQHVQKILLNKLYGLMGLPTWRWYDVDNAEAVTSTGRMVINKTADMANLKYNKELNKSSKEDHVIYLDTDSIFATAVPLLDHRIPNWRKETQEDIAKMVDDIAGEMQDYLNDFYDILSVRMLNVDKTKHRLEIKKEYVAKSGLWIAKKRYAQWIISKKGVPCDELDVKGLDVVRSSFPKAFADLMSKILIDILKDNTQAQLRDLIMEFRSNMKTIDTVDMAKNSAVKSLSKYIPDDSDVLFRFKKGTPAHVKAAISYNELLKHYKTPFKYSPMRNGDKIKWIYLKTNPFGLKTIGFTGYNDPPEITKFIDTYIDCNELFDRELLNKLQDFYTALGWDSVISEQQAASQFFQF